MRIVSVVGARPQFIKLAPVSQELRHLHQEIVVHTGQHYDYTMSAIFFDELALPTPDYHLNIGSASHGAQTGRMLEALERVLMAEMPDLVLVFGDTNSTLAGALAASKLHIPVAHIEAGMRSFNRTMPEEINRLVTDHLSARLYCTGESARQHLRNEGITRGIEVVGDVMYDLLLQHEPEIHARMERLLANLRVEPGAYVLVTVHRAANADDPAAMRAIVHALNLLDMPVIFPVHPRTRARLESYGVVLGAQVQCIEPVGYLAMLALERGARRILTDSGGVQKEAYCQGVPCVTLREETEWEETLRGGWNVLVGTRSEDIVQAVHAPPPREPQEQHFGRGDAAAQIARSLSGEAE